MIVQIYNFDDYRSFLHEWMKSHPNQGYGKSAKIAQALEVSPTLVTFVMNGTKDFTMEQAMDLSEFLGLSEHEGDYLLALVSYARAGKENLRNKIKKKILKLKKERLELKEILPPQIEMSEHSKSLFYSQWYYSGIRLLTSIEGFDTVESIAERFKLPSAKVKKVIELLLAQGLCVEKNGKLALGPQSTHLEANSLLVSRHHSNWRQKSIVHMENMKSDELFFTSPVSIAKKDIPRIRKILIDAIENSFKIIDPSPCEELACLNVDWFRF